MKFAIKGITHRCPWRDQDVALSGCYLNSQDTKHDYCYGCPHVPLLKEKYGLRTFRRLLVNDSATSLKYIYVPAHVDGRQWLVVNTETGERMRLSTYAQQRVSIGNIWWSHLCDADKLPGAPLQFEEDKAKREAAMRAERARGAKRV